MEPRAAYDELIRRTREQALLGSCSALLGWDEQTYMPRGGAEHRGHQMALLAGLRHERATDPRLGELLAAVEGTDLVADPESPEAVNVREIRRSYDRQTRLPRSLVEELARTTTIAQQEWVTARRENDFPRFRPWLERVMDLKRQEAEYLGYDEVAYDALLDEYEPGARSRDLAALFDALRLELVPLATAIASAPRRPDVVILHREYPIDRQRLFGETAAAAVGFDFERGRLDTSAHPFCTGIGPGDCRLTTRYDPHDFGQAFFGILHEVGHGLYEQGLDPEHHGTPMGEAVSLGVHESQSRLWENAVGRSRAFWIYWFPLARQIFREALRDVSLDQFHFAVNHVEPSLIRVEADEVTYNLHILIRFELERALLSGDLPVGDVPGAWAEKYQQYLSLTPPNDTAGCLQDIHWSAGLVGYFPTYTLGNLYAAQFFAQATAELGDPGPAFARGEFAPLLAWLRDRIHRHGQRFRSAALVERVTGRPPDHRPLLQALRSNYGMLYGVA
ncbi:MAG: carboxypeptidase M32 [Isosphaeraceae bacterium]|nr:carboxypeptidase M32 [Isosphaeraceae bacterium]